MCIAISIGISSCCGSCSVCIGRRSSVTGGIIWLYVWNIGLLLLSLTMVAIAIAIVGKFAVIARLGMVLLFVVLV